MAFEFAFDCDRPTLSAPAGEGGIIPGELVLGVSGGGVVHATGTDSRVSGVVERFPDQRIADHPYDYRSSIDNFQYSNGDLVKYAGDEQGARLFVLTPSDNGTDPAVNITQNTVVGIPDISGFEGRVVEEGYTDSGTTTYDRSAGNFNAVGVAYEHSDDSITNDGLPADGFDERVKIVRKTNL